MFRKGCFSIIVKFNRTFTTRHVPEITLSPEKSSKHNRPWTNKFELLRPENYTTMPMYRILDKNGTILNPSEDPQLQPEEYLRIYKSMVLWNIFDNTMFNAHRQGRITFYVPSVGEEGIHMGSAAALTEDDWIHSQYRESGVLLYRGLELRDFMNQLFGNCEDDQTIGRTSPVTYGSRSLKFVTISPPLATQLPQAVGTAYALKRAGQKACVIVYFGEGAASEGDAHAAFNFSATLDCPVIFFCRNNGYAISTPIREQFRGDGIACRAEGYGIAAARIDGNDVLAVYNATRAAHQYATTENKPVLLEAMTYRIGHHSTSDDSSAYRDMEEVEQWQQDSPITRFRLFLESRDLWDSEQEQQFVAAAKKQVVETLLACEKLPKPKVEKMFTDVYDEMPEHIRKQMQFMDNHLNEYKDHYPLKEFES